MTKPRLIILLLILFAIAATLRLYDFRADPPALFADGSQDLATDGAYLTLHARNAVLFGTWDLFGFQHWTPFKISLVSGVSWLLFHASGVSRTTANLAGVLLNLGALVLFVLALGDSRRPRLQLLLAFFLGTSFLVSVYGRQPFTENGLLFLAAMAFFVYQRWFDTAWGKATVGALIILCGMLGKAFGLLLLAGPFWYLLVSDHKSKTRTLAWYLGSAGIVGLLFLLLFYRDQGFLSFLWEHGAGEHGAPHGFSSPLGFLENLISFPRRDLHAMTPIISLLACAAVIWQLLAPPKAPRLSKQSIFMLGWLVAMILFLSPFNYRPLRYLFVLAVPMSMLAAEFLDSLAERRLGGRRRVVWWRMLLLALVLWYAVNSILVLGLVKNGDAAEYYRVVWYALPVAIALTIILQLWLQKRQLAISAKAAKVIIAIALLISVALDARQVYRWLATRTYGLDETSVAVREILGEDAVLSGQYGPVIALNSRMKAFPFFLSSNPEELRTTLAKYPITHLAVSASDWEQLARTAPDLARAQLIENFWLRDNLMSLVRTTGVGPAGYRPSDFERGVDQLYAKRSDSALIYFDRVLARFPHNKAALLERYYLIAPGNLRACQPMIDTLARYYDTDFTVDLLAAVYYKWLSAQIAQTQYQEMAQQYLSLAVQYNRANEANLRRIYQQLSPQQLTAPPRL
jgi:hypothetical protein